ncbi:D(2) dopamine receptor A-like [Saccostrea echinata]|uniref:D(2) dopamine receptor A-like n=1 Tax=Saccostrea echinata TaxID=191078 RepID=UPI002A7F7999|nr:D(2) dopamine receptor A-like [Saccostrea echinata]
MTNVSEYVKRLNDEAVETLIPAIIYVVSLMVIGVVGNPIIVYFYGFKLKTTPSYMFIVALAMFDFVICAISMPLEIVDLVRFYTFESAIACRLLRFVNYFMAISSGLILIAIAVDRYRKICKPFESQITIKMAKIIISCALFVSLCVSWPSFVFYTVVQVNLTDIAGAVGQDCTTRRNDSYKLYITLYNGILFLIFIIAITSLIVLYCLVGKQIFNLRDFRFYAQRKRRKSAAPPQSSTTQCTEETGGFGSFAESNSLELSKFEEVVPTPSRESSRPKIATTIAFMLKKKTTKICETDESNMSDKSSNLPKDSPHNALRLEKMSVSPRSNFALSELSNTDFARKESSRTENSIQVREPSKDFSKKIEGTKNMPSTEETGDAKHSADLHKEKMSVHSIKSKKYTIIMLSITVAFIISFLPYLSLMTWRTLSKDYEPNLLSKSELVAFQIFLRSFLINSAVNPLIYGFLNTEFRNFLKACFCCWKNYPFRQARSNSNGYSRTV